MLLRLLCMVCLFFSAHAYAYPSFVGYGYTSCITCHYNPAGGGPLTDYGRALGATAISAKPFYNPNISDDDLGAQSGFLGKTELPSWVRPAGAFREMLMESDLQNHPKPDWITMQAEGSLTIPLMDGRLFFSGTLGYIPPPEGGLDETASTSTLISREHYAGFLISDALGVYAGYMDPVFGIRAPDHNGFFRSMTLLDQSDQTHALMVHLLSGKFEAEFQAMFGSLYQDSSVRQKGATTMMEYEFMPNARLGFSALSTSSDYRHHEMAAVHTRIGILEGNSILFEAGVQRNAFPILANQDLSEFLWFQSATYLIRGLSLLATIESYVPDLNMPTSRLWNAGPSLDYFPLQRLEFRIDLLATESVGQQSYDPDVYTFLFQTHIWL